jgi:hypothetical protein
MTHHDHMYLAIIFATLVSLQGCGGGTGQGTATGTGQGTATGTGQGTATGTGQGTATGTGQGTATGGAGSMLKVSGTAATGQALSDAEIKLKCQKSTFSTKSNNQGIYSQSVQAIELPCLIRVSAGSLQLHSVASVSTSDMTVNITPHTELVTSHLLGVSSSVVFNSDQVLNSSNVSSTKLTESINLVRLGIASLVNTDGYNPIDHKFSIGDAYDQKLDALQLSLIQKNIDFSDLRQAFIVPLSPNIDRLTYISSFLAPPVVSQADVETQEYLADSASWVAGINSDGSNYYEFIQSRLVDGKIRLNEYTLNSQNTYVYVNPSYQSCSSGSDRILTVSGNWVQPSCGLPILSGSGITSKNDKSEFWLKLNTEQNELSVGKWKINATVRDVSKMSVSDYFNPVYIGNKLGIFGVGSKTYRVLLTAIDSDYYVGVNKVSETAVQASDFTQKYKQQIFCGIPIARYANGSSYSGAKYGVKFSSTAGKAQLIPVDKNCAQVVDGYPLIELDWKLASINNQEAFEFSGAKLPVYHTSVGHLMGGYDANEANPAMRYWTDKYKLIIVKNADGTLYTGIKTAPGASIDVSPGNGPYLNKAALNSMLQLVGYPSFSQ